MQPSKRFALTVARPPRESGPPILVVHIPRDQYEAAGGPAAYIELVERTGVEAVIVSKLPDGSWATTTKIGSAWKAVCDAHPMDSLQWDTMPIEADAYPWEMFRRF